MRAVVVLPNPDPGFDKMRTQRARRDLQPMAVERHGIVVAHLTIFLDAKNFVEINLGDRHKRRTVLLRAHHEQDIVTRDINLADEPVGRVHRRDPGQRQFNPTSRSCRV